MTDAPAARSRREWLKMSAAAATGLAAARAFSASALDAADRRQATDPVTAMRRQMAAEAIKVTKLGERMSMLSGPGGNVTVLHGPSVTLVVDSFVQPAWARVQQTIAGLTRNPVTQLMDTHWHFDHTDNNARFRAAGASILAHVNTKKRLSETHDLMGMRFTPQPVEALPTETFEGMKRLAVDGESIHIESLPPAHTDSDIAIHFGASNVLVTGDVYMNVAYPFFDIGTGGNINGMIAAAARVLLLANATTKIVPGHGPLSNKAELQKTHDMFVVVRDRVQTLKASGRTLQQVLDAKPTADLDATFAVGMMSASEFLTLVYTSL